MRLCRLNLFLIVLAAMLAGACVHLELRVPTAEPAIGMARFTEPPDIVVMQPASTHDANDWRESAINRIAALPDNVKILNLFSRIYKPNPDQANLSGSEPRVENGEVKYVLQFPEATADIIEFAQERGLKVVPYFNPSRFARLYEQTNRGGYDRFDLSDGAVEAVMSAVMQFRDFGFDGIYFDGALPAGGGYYRDDPERAAEYYRWLREQWPDAVIVQHASGRASTSEMDSLVDVTYFGEHGSSDQLPDGYDRWVNTDGEWYMIDGPDHPQFSGFVKELYERGTWPTYKMANIHTPPRGEPGGPEGLRAEYPDGWLLPSEWEEINAVIGVTRTWVNSLRRHVPKVKALKEHRNQVRQERGGLPPDPYVQKAVERFQQRAGTTESQPLTTCNGDSP